MHKKAIFRSLLLITLIIASSLACNLVESISTGVKAVNTGKAVATEIGKFATEFIPAGIDETAQAVITQVNPSGLLETAQLVVTEKAPSVGKTVQAVVTEVYTSPESAPADIPVMKGDINAFIGSQKSVSYFVNAELQDVLNFYRQQMPLKGWQEQNSGNLSNKDLVEIHYQKTGHTATVILTQIPFMGQTTVVITIDESSSN
jgi:hypothetical protein